MDKGMLIFLCGKMGAGKSTLSPRLAREQGAILLSEDEWLAALYGDDIRSFDDYLRFSSRLRSILKPHVQGILRSGVSVVMDFPANTRTQRAWFREIIAGSGATHRLVYLEASDETCLRQIGQRRKAQPERVRFDTEAVFRQVTSYFQPPSEDEGFSVEVIVRS